MTEVVQEIVWSEQMKAMIQPRCIEELQEVIDLTGRVSFLGFRESVDITGQSFVVEFGLLVT